MSHQLVTVQGNTGPDINIQLLRSGAPIKLARATVDLVLKKGDGTVANSGHQSCTVVDADKGKIRYSVVGGDFADTGSYTGEVQINFSGGKVEKVYETFSVEARA